MSSEKLSVTSTNLNSEAAVVNPTESENSIVKRRRLTVSEMIDRWNLSRLIDELGTHEQCVAFAEKHHLVPINKKCRIHKKLMKVFKSDSNFGKFVCCKARCSMNKKICRAKGTWFENAKIDLVQVFYLMYTYAHQWSQERVIWEDILKTQRKKCLSSKTVCNWYKCCQEAVVIYQLEQQDLMGKIGGPGKVVRIYESKFEKRKYNKGADIEGRWVLGMIENGNEDLRLEVCSKNELLGHDLVPLIKKHVQEGTTICTSLCKAYECLSDYGFIHKKVNQSNTENSSEANNVNDTLINKPQWRDVKQFSSRKKCNYQESFADIMVEYLYRRNIKKNYKDPFMELISVIKHVYKIKI